MNELLVANTGNAAVPGYEEEVTLVDSFRFLYKRRVLLLISTVFFMSIGFSTLAMYWAFQVPAAKSRILLTFPGIQHHKYPSGKPFSIEDMRSPDIMYKIADEYRGIDIDVSSAIRLLDSALDIAPVIPESTVNRWKRQERDGQDRDVYFPTEYKIILRSWGGRQSELADVMFSLVRYYRSRVKSEEVRSRSGSNGRKSLDARDLLLRFDYWDIPNLVGDFSTDIDRRLGLLIEEASHDDYDEYRLGFQKIRHDLRIWSLARFEQLKAAILGEKIVKNKQLMRLRLADRLQDIEIKIRRGTEEIAEATKLLDIIIKSRPMVGAPITDASSPTIDKSFFEQMIENDYVGPQVNRIADLQFKIKNLEAEKWEVQLLSRILVDAKELPYANLPQETASVVTTTVDELNGLAQRFEETLDKYVAGTVEKNVRLVEGPTVAREEGGGLMIPAIFIVIISLCGALVVTYVGHLYTAARS